MNLKSKSKWKSHSFLRTPSKDAVHFEERITRDHVEHLMEMYREICDDFGVQVPELDMDMVQEDFEAMFPPHTFLTLFDSTAGQGYMIGAWEVADDGGGDEDEEVIVIG